MTAKEKVLSVYPDAFEFKTLDDIGILSKIRAKETGEIVISTSKIRTSKQAWQNALNELIKQGLSTE
jgi:hypothetical protein